MYIHEFVKINIVKKVKKKKLKIWLVAWRSDVCSEDLGMDGHLHETNCLFEGTVKIVNDRKCS